MAYIDHGKMIEDTDGGRWIPKDRKNRDYRKLLASGADIQPAPPPPQPTPSPNEQLVQALRQASGWEAVRDALVSRFGG